MMQDFKLNLVRDGKGIQVGYREHFANLARVNESLNQGAAENYQKNGLTYVDVPQIVGITGACENVDTLFKVGNRLDLPLFFTQTGQLALEQALQSFSGVFTVIHSGRDEEEEDERHLRQFRLTEEEFDCSLLGMTRNNYDEEKMFEGLLAHIQGSVQAIILRVIKDNGDLLEKQYKRRLKFLEMAARSDFLRIKYEEAVKLLNKHGFSNLKFGEDLEAKHEAKIVKLLNRKNGELPVFISHYPKQIKFFNMKVFSKDPRVVLSADLIFPRAGEATGSAVREHNFNRLNERLISSTMFRLHLARGGKYEDFSWYLNIIKEKLTQPHAGYGIGNERVLQYLFGVDDIRTVSLFSLLNKQSGDWDAIRYGQAAAMSLDKKCILLSIGRESDKKQLLRYVKLLKNKKELLLYATEHTHEFLKRKGVKTSLVYKISQLGKSPNIADLMQRRVFDLIVNIPTRKEVKVGKEFTDGKLIRKGAVDMGISLITDVEVAGAVMDNLSSS